MKNLILTVATGVLLFATTVATASDVGPRPEEALEQAGIATTIPEMTAAMLDPASEEDVRYYAARALGRTGDKAVLESLLLMLDHPSPTLRIGAMLGLQELGLGGHNELVTPYFENILGSDEMPELRQLALSALATIGKNDAFLAVARDTTESENLRVNAITQLGLMGSKSAAVELRPLTRDATSSVRASAAISLAQLGDDFAIPYLAEVVLSPDSVDYFRVGAASQLKKLTGSNFAYSDQVEDRGGQEREEALAEVAQWWKNNKFQYETEELEEPLQ